MTTLTLVDYTEPTPPPANVIQFDRARTAVLRGIAEAIWYAGARYHASQVDCIHLVRRAKQAYKKGQASPAAAIADAVASMRRRARQGGAA